MTQTLRSWRCPVCGVAGTELMDRLRAVGVETLRRPALLVAAHGASHAPEGAPPLPARAERARGRAKGEARRARSRLT